MRFICSLFIFIFIIKSANAGELTGFIALDNRLFLKAPAFSQQKMSNGPSLVVEPEYYHVTEDEKNIFTFSPFARIDFYDDKRNHFDIRQLDWVRANSEWEFKAGISRVFWGVTESNHLVDIINQTDGVEDFDGEDKLGQPMLQFGLFKEWGNLRLFYLPYFRQRTFAGVDGRLRSEKPVETDITTYDASQKEWHPDFAVRYTKIIGDWDIGLSHFSGTSREPVFIESRNADGQDIFNPHYDLIDQTSIDLQYTKEGWLWKLEAMTRTGHGRRFAAATGGVEYTLYAIAGSDMDLGILTEYQFDDRSGQAPGTFADNDIFAGVRLTFNDIEDTAILGGASIDNNTHGMFFFFEAERRISNNWKVEFDARISANIKHTDPEAGFRKDNHMQLRIARYF
ncbi:hypothetical protein N9W34_04560 [Rickettsiales bacterium]|nr:hypothetical protein [Rickettsiales bacterium]